MSWYHWLAAAADNDISDKFAVQALARLCVCVCVYVYWQTVTTEDNCL